MSPSRRHIAASTIAVISRLLKGRNILQDIGSGEEQYFIGPNQNLPDRKV